MTYMQRIFAVFLSLALLLGAVPPGAARAAEEPLVISDGTFTYTSAVLTRTNAAGKEEAALATYPFSYNENWFLQDSTVYDHGLAKMSLRMAMAAAMTTGDAIVPLLETLGFGSITPDYPQPTGDTIGYVIGSKQLPAADATLIAVAVRGGGYGEEWADNFRVGTSGEHEGFRNAADRVTAAIEHYIEANGLSGRLKIWITGYSRAAAVTNLTAHRLNTAARAGTLPGLSEQSVYAYCFEGPGGVRRDAVADAPLDRNIFNIFNSQDLVPMFAPGYWDFAEYGITYCLPSAGTEYGSWPGLLDAMRRSYREILGHGGVPASEANAMAASLTTFLPAQTLLMRQTVDILATHYGSQEQYVQTHQETVMAALAKLFTGDGSIRELMSTISSTMPFLLYQHRPVTNTLIVNLDAVTQAHYPELCLAWMDSLDGAQLQKPAQARLLTVNGSAEISVYDGENRLAARLTDSGTLTGSLEGFVDENGQKRLILPAGEPFRVEIAARAGGTLSFQVNGYDFAARQYTRLADFRDVPVAAGEVLTLTPSGAARQDGTGIAPGLEAEGEDIAHHSLTVSQAGAGTVTGGGCFLPGEYALVTAQPRKDQPFYGWYVDGSLVSTERAYRFRMETDTVITGYFEEYTAPVPPEEPEPPTEPEEPEEALLRLAGDNRFETAFLAADAMKAQLGVEAFENILVASGTNFADALSGSYLAAVKKAPILLSFRDAVNDTVKDYIRANLKPGGTVYILGGEAAVPASMETGLEAFTVKRLAGADRFSTNLAILAEAGTGDAEILVCTGLDFADSLSASACGQPILLVWDALTEEQTAFLEAHGTNGLCVIGGESAVSARMEARLKAYGTVERIGGSNRFETSAAIAERFFPSPDAAVLAYAWNYPDGLCGGPLAALLDGPLLLTMAEQEAPAADYLQKKAVVRGLILGGEGLIPDASVSRIFGEKNTK